MEHVKEEVKQLDFRLMDLGPSSIHKYPYYRVYIKNIDNPFGEIKKPRNSSFIFRATTEVDYDAGRLKEIFDKISELDQQFNL